MSVEISPNSPKRKFSDTIDDDRFQNESPFPKKQKKQQNLDQYNSLNVDKKTKNNRKIRRNISGKILPFFPSRERF